MTSILSRIKDYNLADHVGLRALSSELIPVKGKPLCNRVGGKIP